MQGRQVPLPITPLSRVGYRVILWSLDDKNSPPGNKQERAMERLYCILDSLL